MIIGSRSLSGGLFSDQERKEMGLDPNSGSGPGSDGTYSNRLRFDLSQDDYTFGSGGYGGGSGGGSGGGYGGGQSSSGGGPSFDWAGLLGRIVGGLLGGGGQSQPPRPIYVPPPSKTPTYIALAVGAIVVLGGIFMLAGKKNGQT